MPPSDPEADASLGQSCLFVTTHWSVVLAAGNDSSPEASEALNQLCRGYWFPVYAYVRHRGYSPSDAQDLTQEFFARLADKNYLTAVQRERGKFRWFLLAAVKRFLVNEWNREHTAKHGGRMTFLSLDGEMAERRYYLGPAHNVTPEKLFDRSWALTLLEAAHARLFAEQLAAGKGPLFDALNVFLASDKGPLSYADVAASLGMSEGAVKVAVHRLRARYRECLREEIARTVATAVEVDEEIRDMFAAFES